MTTIRILHGFFFPFSHLYLTEARFRTNKKTTFRGKKIIARKYDRKISDVCIIKDVTIEYLSECNALENVEVKQQRRLGKPTPKDLIFRVFFYHSQQFEKRVENIYKHKTHIYLYFHRIEKLKK